MTDGVTYAYLILWVWPSHLGLPLLLGTVLFSKHVKRHPAFINLLVVFILCGIASSLLLYVGKEDPNGLPPSKILCAFQATLLEGENLMISLSLLGLAYAVFSAIHASVDPERDQAVSSLLDKRKWTLLLIPYVAWLVCAYGTSLYMIVDPDIFVRLPELPVCSVRKSSGWHTAMSVITSFVLCCAMCFEGVVWYNIIQMHRKIGIATRVISDTSLRIHAFSLLLPINFIAQLASIADVSSPTPSLIMASLGSLIVLIFGTQPDVLGVWVAWLRLPTSIVPGFLNRQGLTSKVDARIRAEGGHSVGRPVILRLDN